MCAKSTIIQNKREGLKFCKICQCIVEDVEEHMKRKHPEYAKYLKKREKKENLSICGYCGSVVKNWRDHVQEYHPELIAKYTRKKKPEKKEEKEDLTEMFNL
ncbi:MAG: hypothetical protein U9O98_02455 [Asgard group archaeon]|nr:hypothetical protein [Asgard group archaeon]